MRVKRMSTTSTWPGGITLFQGRCCSPRMRTFPRVVGFWVGLLLSVSVSAQPAAADRRAPLAAAVATFTAKTERVSNERTKLLLRPKETGGAAYKLHNATGQEIAVTVASNGMIEAVVDPNL